MTENAGVPMVDVTESGSAMAPAVTAVDMPAVDVPAVDVPETGIPAGADTPDPLGDEGSSGAQSSGDAAVPSGSEDLGSGEEAGGAGSKISRHDLLVAEGDAAGDYLERLLDILDFDGDIDLDVEGERAVVSIIGDGDVDKLVGDHGEVLDALQELSRLAANAETGQRSRLMLDIAGYRARRRTELTELGRRTAEQVIASGEPVRLAAMNPFERKVVHDAVGTIDGATSSSDGEEPHRRVVVSPAG